MINKYLSAFGSKKTYQRCWNAACRGRYGRGLKRVKRVINSSIQMVATQFCRDLKTFTPYCRLCALCMHPTEIKNTPSPHHTILAVCSRITTGPPDRQHQVLQVLPSIRWKDCRRRQTEKEHQSSQLLWHCSKTSQLLFNFFYRHCLIKVLLHIFSVLESWGWNHHYWKMGKCNKSHFAGFHIWNYNLTV